MKVWNNTSALGSVETGRDKYTQGKVMPHIVEIQCA